MDFSDWIWDIWGEHIQNVSCSVWFLCIAYDVPIKKETRIYLALALRRVPFSSISFLPSQICSIWNAMNIKDSFPFSLSLVYLARM